MVCCISAYNQISQPDINRPVKTLLSSVQNKANAVKDSLKTSTNNLLHNAPVKPGAAQVMHPSDTAKPVAAAPKDSSVDALTDDEPTTYFFKRLDCKVVVKIPIYAYVYIPVEKEPMKIVEPVKPKPVPFLQVHGNIMYNVNYYSNIDTVYNEQNIFQHTIQTYLDVTVKGQYPMRVYLTNRFTNSKLFRNFSDLNFGYNSAQFTEKIKAGVRQQYLSSLPSLTAPDSLKNELDAALKKLHSLEAWIKNPGLLQKMVEAREKAMRDSLMKLSVRKPDTGFNTQAPGMKVVADSVLSKLGIDSSDIQVQYTRRKQQVDSLQKRIVALQQMIKSCEQKLQKAKYMKSEIAQLERNSPSDFDLYCI